MGFWPNNNGTHYSSSGTTTSSGSIDDDGMPAVGDWTTKTTPSESSTHAGPQNSKAQAHPSQVYYVLCLTQKCSSSSEKKHLQFGYWLPTGSNFQQEENIRW